MEMWSEAAQGDPFTMLWITATDVVGDVVGSKPHPDVVMDSLRTAQMIQMAGAAVGVAVEGVGLLVEGEAVVGTGGGTRTVYTATDAPVDLARPAGPGTSGGIGGTFVTDLDITDPVAAVRHARGNIPAGAASRPGGVPKHISRISVPEGALRPDPHGVSPPNWWLPPGAEGQVTGTWVVVGEDAATAMPVIRPGG